MARSDARGLTVAAAAAAAATALCTVLPELRLAYEAPSLRVAIETGATLVALLAAYLVLGRFVREPRVDSLLFVAGLGVLAGSNLLAALLLAVPPSETEGLLVNAAAAVGAALLAAAAFAPVRPLARGGRAILAVVVGSAAALVLALALLELLDHLFGTGGLQVVRDTRHPQLESNVALLAAETATAAAFLAAAVGFARRAAASDDTFFRLVAAGAVLGGFAKVNYVLFAPAQSGLVRTGDLFRALFYAVLLVAAGREIEDYWRGLAGTAVLEERRRIARDLHDGVAQELAFIGRRAKRLAAERPDRTTREILASAERALGDSRRAIVALTKPLDEPLADVLAEAAAEVAERYDVALDLALEPGVRVDVDRREALVRIACEAVSNAARHGRAEVVSLRLSSEQGLRFAIADDGAGFDPEAPAAGRFGIEIMRERARAAGGSFRLRSAPGRGTEVEVVFP